MRKVEIIDKESILYPDTLRNIQDPPRRLYCSGDISLLHEKIVSVVGSRKFTVYGKMTAKMIGRNLARNGIVVSSGLAYGIDAFAHEGALEGSGKPIGVLGMGIDKFSPAVNKRLFNDVANKGLVISEYEPDFEATKYSFPQRNRIISGICDALVVIEAGVSSGALITAQYALEQGKKVYAVPGNINSQFSMGTNLLIRDGATPLIIVDDLVTDIGAQIKDHAADEKAFGTEESSVLEVISKNSGINVNELAHKLDKKVGTVGAILTVLEIKGAIVSVGGKIYLAK